jgi:hypothetical protein
LARSREQLRIPRCRRPLDQAIELRGMSAVLPQGFDLGDLALVLGDDFH